MKFMSLFLHVFVVFLFSSMRIAHAWALWRSKNKQKHANICKKKQIGAIKLEPWNAAYCRWL